MSEDLKKALIGDYEETPREEEANTREEGDSTVKKICINVVSIVISGIILFVLYLIYLYLIRLEQQRMIEEMIQSL